MSHEPKHHLDLTITCFMLALGLGLLAAMSRVVGFSPGSEVMTAEQAFDQGRLQGAREAVFAALAAGFGWVGLSGLTGATRQLMLGRVLAMTGVGAGVALLVGMRFTAAVLAIATLSLLVQRRQAGGLAAETGAVRSSDR